MAEHIAARLRAAGFDDKDLTLFSVADHPQEGGVVAVLAGRYFYGRGTADMKGMDAVCIDVMMRFK